MPHCKHCGEWPAFLDRHVCPPIWETRIDSDSDLDWREFHGRHPEDAAERAAEVYDSGGDYPLLNGGTAMVAVKPKGGDAIQYFEVYGESLPRYHVNIADRPDPTLPTPAPAVDRSAS